MDALDRELSAALDVDPSPEFLARVRARVAREPAPAFWRMPRLLLAAGALAVVVVVSAIVVQPRDPDVASEFRLRSASARPAPAATEEVAPAPARHRRPRRAGVIRLVSIDDMPTVPIGDVVPAMRVDVRFDAPAMTFDVVTMTGVHP